MEKRFNVTWHDGSNQKAYTWFWPASTIPNEERADGDYSNQDAWDTYVAVLEDDTGYCCDCGGGVDSHGVEEEDIDLADCDSKTDAYNIAVRTKAFTDAKGWSSPTDPISLKTIFVP